MSKLIRVTTLIHLSITATISCAHPTQGQAPPKTIKEALPSTVWCLLQWPDAAILRGEKRMDPDALVIVSPKERSWTWIKRALDASWVPPAETEMIFIREEIGKLDVSRIQWDRNEYHIEVAQTASVFSMKLVPLGSGGTGSDSKSRFEYARQLCLRLFNPEGQMWSHEPGKTGIPIPVAELNKRIAAFSFDQANSKDLPSDNAVAGGVTSATHNPMVRRGKVNTSAAGDIAATDDAWNYWFRNIYWWNDGKAVGFYFLKTAGAGSWFASWAGDIDVNWFHEPRDRRGRPLPAR